MMTLSLISYLFLYLTKKVIYGTLNSNEPAMYPKILEAQSLGIASKIYGAPQVRYVLPCVYT